MVISSLVVTLVPDAVRRAAALASLSTRSELTLGEPIGVRVPVVAEHVDAGAGAAVFDELSELDGVLRVDVISIDFLEGA